MLEKLFCKSTPILAKIPIICLKLFIIPPMILLECVSKIVLGSSTILYSYNPLPRNVPLTQVFYIRLNSCLKYFKKSILSTFHWVRMLRITSKVKNVFLPLWNWKLKDTLHLEHHFHFISVISLRWSDKKNFWVSFLQPFIFSNLNHLVTRSLCTVNSHCQNMVYDLFQNK